jgi:cell division protein FtsW
MGISERTDVHAGSVQPHRRKWHITNSRIDEVRSKRIGIWQSRLLMVAAALSVFGICASFSSTVFLNIALEKPAYRDFLKHVLFLLLGGVIACLVFWVLSRVLHSKRWLKLIIPGAFLVSLILVMLVMVPGIGHDVNGAWRFLKIGSFRFQPSELLKITVVLYLAQLLCWWRKTPRQQSAVGQDLRDEYTTTGMADVESAKVVCYNPSSKCGSLWQRLMQRPEWPALPKRAAALLLVAVLITAVQPDLGSAGIIFCSGLLTIFLAGVSGRQFAMFIGGIVAAVAIAAGILLLSDGDRYSYAFSRLDTWAGSIMHWSDEEDSAAYQLTQSRGAIAVAGLWGKGFLKSDQKMNRLPLSTNDFIFPVVVEELGYLGGLTVIVLFLALAWTGMRLAFCLRDPFNRTVVAALGMMICLQAFVNIGVTLGVLPLSGLTLPLFSAGGTSIVVTCTAIGLMLGFASMERQGRPGGTA